MTKFIDFLICLSLLLVCSAFFGKLLFSQYEVTGGNIDPYVLFVETFAYIAAVAVSVIGMHESLKG
jgi:hypothetical protein